MKQKEVFNQNIWHLRICGDDRGDLYQVEWQDDEIVMALGFSFQHQTFNTKETEFRVSEFRAQFIETHLAPDTFDDYMRYADSLSVQMGRENMPIPPQCGLNYMLRPDEGEHATDKAFGYRVRLNTLRAGFSEAESMIYAYRRYFSTKAYKKMEALSSKMRFIDQMDAQLKDVFVMDHFYSFMGNGGAELIRDGERADENIGTLHIMQQIIYVDEEVAAAEIPNGSNSFSMPLIGDLDAWIVDNDDRVDRLLPYPKCIAVMRYARPRQTRMKKSPYIHRIPVCPFVDVDPSWTDVDDQCEYVLVRNGDRVYRAWLNLKIKPNSQKVLPVWEGEKKRFNENENGIDLINTGDLQKDGRVFLVWLQGLLHSPDFFPNFRNLDVLNGADFDVGRVVLVDQNESGDAYEKWRVDALQELRKGDRVFFAPGHGLDSYTVHSDIPHRKRIGGRDSGRYIPTHGIYTVERVDDESVTFLWQHGEESRRKSYKLFWVDWFVFNFEALSEDVVECMMYDRAVRQYHLESLPALWEVYKLLLHGRQDESTMIDEIVSCGYSQESVETAVAEWRQKQSLDGKWHVAPISTENKNAWKAIRKRLPKQGVGVMGGG